MKAVVIGCGLAGTVAANLLKKANFDVEVFETRNHIAGNCFDSNVCGTLVHNYGPHIFHTDNDDVFKFLSKHTEWTPFSLQPKGNTKLGIISLPYSRKTVHELGRELTQEEIREYIFKDYSEKQWGVPFSEIPDYITNRIPKTKDCENPTWFGGQKYQCIPKYGYTKMFESMLDGVPVHLGCDASDGSRFSRLANLIVFTGKIDEYFDYHFGRLPYRTLEFKHYVTMKYQDTFIVNQNISLIPYTRRYDHRYFTVNHSGPTVITEEYSLTAGDDDIAYYPIPFNEGPVIYEKYKSLTSAKSNVIFLGRLATYKYMDMQDIVLSVMNTLREGGIWER